MESVSMGCLESVSMGCLESVSMGCVASIDSLPDDLLVQILSLLPTKQAVSTSVITKRWMTLFYFSHNLDCDDSIFSYPEKSKRESFWHFVNRRLDLQSGNYIKKFSLRYKETLGISKLKDLLEAHVKVMVYRWIYNALEHGVSELHLRIKRPTLHRDLPSKVFTNTRLVKLSLGTEIRIPSLPSDTYLPALKVLVLDIIWFKGNQLSDVFLAACPALEDLTINQKDRSEGVVISSKTIKSLSVTYNCYNYFHHSGIISLDAPSLVDLNYSDYARPRSLHCNLDSLVKATLDLHFTNNSNDGGVTDLLSGIRNVKTLHLTSSSVKVISVCCKKQLPLFNNLVDLVFLNKKLGWEVLLPLMLEHSPNLKTLVLSCLDSYTYRQHRSSEGFCIPPNNQVKMLSIMEYQGSDHELKHISHFLTKMECLEVVRVYVSPKTGDPKMMQLTEDLLKLPTSSSELKIQVMRPSRYKPLICICELCEFKFFTSLNRERHY